MRTHKQTAPAEPSQMPIHPGAPDPARRTFLRGAAYGLATAGLVAVPVLTRQVAHAQASAAPEWLGLLPQARRWGRAPFRFFGLAIYDIALWAPPGFDAARYANSPLALELTYARALDGKSIAERSITEMRRVASIDAVQEKRWLEWMVAAFPDVKPQDRLAGIHDGKGGVQFWFNGKIRSQHQDPEFARLFFGIWLAETTSAPALRQSLIEAARA